MKTPDDGISPEAKEEIESCRRRSIYFKMKYESLPKDKKNEATENLQRILSETFSRFPDEVQDIVLKYWSTQSEKTKTTLPVIKIDSFFTTGYSRERIPAEAMVNPEGTVVTIEFGLLFAPEEVVVEVCAHELTHVYFIAKGSNFSDSNISRHVRDVYSPKVHGIEQGVHDQLEKWGFSNNLLLLWQVAVETKNDGWLPCYLALKDEQVFKNAQTEWSKDKNEPIYQYNLACCYHWRIGTTPDYSKAFQLYHEAHEKGLVAATLNLGILYQEGKGVEKNILKAAALYKKAAEMGNLLAKVNLANLLLLGRHQNELPVLPEQAMSWLEEAAKEKHPSALHNLGLSYLTGIHVPQDIPKGKSLLKQAALLGHPDSEETLQNFPC